MDENQSDPPEKITPVELAMLAAVIDPRACQSGNFRSTLLQALALFEESAAICQEMSSRNCMELLEMLEKGSLSGSSGSRQLFNTLVSQVLSARRERILTLAAHDGDSDTVRPYLAKELNLEGKTGRKVWSRTRTVRDNLRLMCIDRANQWNRANAARILAHERQEEEQARKDRLEALLCGVSVGLVSDGRFRPAGGWRDGQKEFEEFMSRCEVRKEGKVHHHEIPQVTIDALVEWKREIRRRGGIKTIRPLTREEVLGKPVKKKNPKRLR
jgi:hypothetical protein